VVTAINGFVSRSETFKFKNINDTLDDDEDEYKNVFIRDGIGGIRS
jgi:hypothetical protein